MLCLKDLCVIFRINPLIELCGQIDPQIKNSLNYKNHCEWTSSDRSLEYCVIVFVFRVTELLQYEFVFPHNHSECKKNKIFQKHNNWEKK